MATHGPTDARTHTRVEQTTSIPERAPETAAAQTLVNRGGEERKTRRVQPSAYEGRYLERQTPVKEDEGLRARESPRRFIYRYCCAPPFLPAAHHPPPAANRPPPSTPPSNATRPFSNPRLATRCTSRPAPCGLPPVQEHSHHIRTERDTRSSTFPFGDLSKGRHVVGREDGVELHRIWKYESQNFNRLNISLFFFFSFLQSSKLKRSDNKSRNGRG